MKRPAITAMTGAAAIVLLAGACSSAPTKTTGTETFQGTATGATVIANSTTYPLKFTGPVTATATWTTPSGNADKVTTTFKTTAGNLVVNADVNANNPATTVDASTCLAKFTITGTYTVDGAQSTDKFKGATGHGTIKERRPGISAEAEQRQVQRGQQRAAAGRWRAVHLLRLRAAHGLVLRCPTAPARPAPSGRPCRECGGP